tara:strand:- start:889 stop:3228 length:2340 start_codon:yes stop_codon:yes gene_type:complete
MTPQEKFRLKKRAEREAAGGFEQTFTYKGKTYTLPTRFPKKDIETLKEFLKSFDEWKAGGGNFQSYIDMPSRVKSMAAAKKVGKKTSAFDNRAGNVWRRFVQYAKGNAPVNPGRKGTGELYKIFFDQLDIPKSELNVIKNLDFENIQKFKQGKITEIAAIKNVGDPLMGEIIEWTNKNKGATKEDFFKAFKKIGSDKEILAKAITAYQGAIRNLTKIARGDVIGETQEKLFKAFKPNQLDVFSKELNRIFPNEIRRGFETTLREVYKDNPRTLKSALNKYEEYRKLTSALTKEFDLSAKGGMKGLGKGAFQLDHPISFSVLKKTGNLADAIRVNPVTGDVNQFKLMFDKRLVTLRNNIAAGKEGAQSAFEALQRANKRLFGKLAADFDIKDTGKIKVRDYGAAKFTDKTFDPRVALKENLNLSNVLRDTKFNKGVYRDLKEAGVNVERFDAERAKLNRVDVEKMALFIDDALANAKANGPICKIVGKKQSGGPIVSCVDAVNDALEKDPKKLAQEINRSNEGGAFNKIKNSGTKFLTALKENPNLLRGGLPGKIALGLGTVVAGAGAGALVKQFRNDDPSTYLTNDSQMEGMIIADVEQKGKEVDDNILLDNQFKLELAGAAGLTAPIAKGVYQTARGVGEAGPLPEGRGRFMSALGLNKGVLGKGLWALGAPAIAIPSTIGYIAQDVREGKDASEIATNPLNYLSVAFMNPAVKALGKAGMSRGLLGIASLGLAGTAAGAVALPAISIGAGLATLGTLGYQGYKLFTGKNRSDEEFFR